jgi:TPR repeat protein
VDGTGVAHDEAEAVRWYCLAAHQGHVSAQYNIGVCFAHGTGVTENDTEAVRWYRVAADQGYASAQSALSQLACNLRLSS